MLDGDVYKSMYLFNLIFQHSTLNIIMMDNTMYNLERYVNIIINVHL